MVEKIRLLNEALNETVGMQDRLIPLNGISDKASKALELDVYLGSGTFSYVYQLTETEVVKFSRDLKALELLQRLGEKSPYFPKVFDIYSKPQAKRNDGMEYCAALMEKLNIKKPKWAYELVSFYRSEGYIRTHAMSAIQFYKLQAKIKSEEIFVPSDCAQGLAEAFGLLAQECISNFYCGDLRADANIMTRDNGQLVIADPAHSYAVFNE